jgi:hypothetical protein
MTPAARALSGIPVVTSFVLASACARTGDIERADPDADRRPAAGSGDTGSTDAGTNDTGVSDDGGDDTTTQPDAGGIDSLEEAVGNYCLALRDCDPDRFEQRFGPGTSGCADALTGQLTSYYEQGVISRACFDAYREALVCTVETGYCGFYYDEYTGEEQVSLQPAYDCAPVFRILEEECDVYGYDDGYDDGGFAP